MSMVKRSKYNNKKTYIGGLKFDSIAESLRYEQLVLLERAGEISSLAMQVPFNLHAGIKYVADFTYTEKGRLIAEDVKGAVTQAFALKKRLFKADYPDIELRIISAKDV